MIEGLTRRLGNFLAAATYSDLPPSVIAEAKRATLDWLGSVIAGSHEPPARMAREAVAAMGDSAVTRAFLRGVSSHILELDDIHKTSTVHAAAPIISAALSVAEREQADGRAFLLAVVLGYEAAFRIGEAVNPSHYRYWHPTGTAATFGAAAAAGSLLHLAPEQMLHALGSAGTQAAGLWEFNADGAMSKHLHPGKAAMNGILAADLAKAGFTGATRILEGDRGFFQAMSATHDSTRITDRLGAHWKILENCYKLHPCCAHTHTAIDLALQWGRLQPAAGFRPQSLLVETYAPGYEIVKDPNPTTPFQAKFSLAYCVAAAFLDGRVTLSQFAPQRLADPAIRDLLTRVQVTVADDLTAKYPQAWPSRLTITSENGEVFRATADYPRGNPENPVSTLELEAKFRSLTASRLSPSAINHAIESVRSLDAESAPLIVV